MPLYSGIQADDSHSVGDSLTGAGPLPWSEVWVRRKRPKLTYYLAAIIAFIVVDTPWLLIWSRSLGHMYQRIQGEPLKFKPAAAIPVYLAMSFLVSRPNCKVEAFMMGLCCYAVYEWTNYSTLSNYFLAFAIADTFWGGVLTLTVYSILSHRRVTKYVL